MAVEEGQKAPEFALAQSDGSVVKLEDLRGQVVVLYFYPKDDTPGCTTEACSFRDNWTELQQAGATVLGMSPDSVNSHKRFSDKFSLPFPLLSDIDKTTVQEYGVWAEKSMYGKMYMGVERTTFVIDREGVIRRIFRKVKVNGHTEEVLEAVRAAAS